MDSLKKQTSNHPYRNKQGHVLVAALTILALLASLSLWAIATWPDEQPSHTTSPHAPQGEQKPFTIIALPDTQFYTETYPETFEAQTKWIASQKTTRNIAFVTNLGDIVNYPNDEVQWRVADRAMSHLDGIVPYALVPGNHDFDANDHAPLLKKYFPIERLQKSTTWGGSFLAQTRAQDLGTTRYDTNSYHLFSAGGENYIAIALEYCPPDDVVDWTRTLLYVHADRKAIIATHLFLNQLGDRADVRECQEYFAEGDNGGAEIWDKLIDQDHHQNIILFLGAHNIETTEGAARRTDIVEGRPVHQLLSNYQDFGQGGDGYLRIMTFVPQDKKIKVETYSPYLDNYRTDPQNQFELSL